MPAIRPQLMQKVSGEEVERLVCCLVASIYLESKEKGRRGCVERFESNVGRVTKSSPANVGY